MNGTEIDRTPEEIESHILETRASLDRKLEALEDRLSPRRQLQRLRGRVEIEPYIGWVAVGAIAAGIYLAVRGGRRVQPATTDAFVFDPPPDRYSDSPS